MENCLFTELKGQLDIERGKHLGDTIVTFKYNGDTGLKVGFSESEEIYSKDSTFKIKNFYTQEYIVSESTNYAKNLPANITMEVVPDENGECELIFNQYTLRIFYCNLVSKVEEMFFLPSLALLYSDINNNYKDFINLEALKENQVVEQIVSYGGPFEGDLQYINQSSLKMFDSYNGKVFGTLPNTIKSTIHSIRIVTSLDVNIGDISAFSNIGYNLGSRVYFIFQGNKITYSGELLTALGNSWKNSQKNSTVLINFTNPNGSVTVNGSPVGTEMLYATFAASKVSLPFNGGTYESTDGETWNFVS